MKITKSHRGFGYIHIMCDDKEEFDAFMKLFDGKKMIKND